VDVCFVVRVVRGVFKKVFGLVSEGSFVTGSDCWSEDFQYTVDGWNLDV